MILHYVEDKLWLSKKIVHFALYCVLRGIWQIPLLCSPTART
jgi:hypothetical protein